MPKSDHTPRSGPLHAALAAGAIAALAPLALIIAGVHRGRAAYDATAYHERFIRNIADALPTIDVADSFTATTPGYHLLLAPIAAATGSTTALRLASALIGALCVALLAAAIARRTTTRTAVLLTLPFACSGYVISSSAHILPDNLGWVLVLLTLLIALRDRVNAHALALGSLTLAALVFVRQVHLWAAAPLCVAAWMSASPKEHNPTTITAPRLKAASAALLACVPAVAIVATFALHWEGLTPPRFQGDMQAINPATPLFLLLELALLSAVFAPLLLPLVLARAIDHPRTVAAAAFAAFVASLVIPNTYSEPMGRSTGWWVIVEMTPDIAHVNTAMLVMAPIGAAVLAAMCLSLNPRQGWIALAAALAFAAAQSATLHSWTRYHEPFILLALPLVIASAREHAHPRPGRLTVITVAVGSLVLLAVAAPGLLTARTIEPNETPPPRHSVPTDPWFTPQLTLSATEGS